MIERDGFYKEAGWHFDDGYKVKPGDPYRKLAEQKGLHNRFLFDSGGNLVPESKRPQGLSELMSVFDKNDLKKYYDKFIAGILMIGAYETN